MEGTIVLGQRALGAEPATAGAVAAIKIVTRTECHRACPKGTTSKGERGPYQVATSTDGFYNRICPKEPSVSSALTCPNEDQDGHSPFDLPNPATSLMNPVPITSRLWSATLLAILES